MPKSVSNNGIGALYGTFVIAKKTGGDYCLTRNDIGKAVGLSSNNEIDFGSSGGVVLGRLEYIDSGIATVQICGVVRVPCEDFPGVVGCAVCPDGRGGVYRCTLGGFNARGIVLALDEDSKTCDVLL